MAQTPQTDSHWIMNNTFSDEFNSSMKNIWLIFNKKASWGSSYFRPQNIEFGYDNDREYIRFIGEMKNGIPYTGGIVLGPHYNGITGLGYGYYEIEARLLQTSGIISGLWPTFWTHHSSTNPPPHWNEEIDIFEPNNYQVRRNEHHVGYWYTINEELPAEGNNLDKMKGFKYDVDMSAWHKYAAEWLPGRLTFYIDDTAFFVLSTVNGAPTPSHQNPNLFIDLQTDDDLSPPNIANGLLGYFDVNYFRYYQLECDNAVINSCSYNFSTYNYKVKKSITIGGSGCSNSLLAGDNVSLRATDFIEIKGDFYVPVGAELYLDVNPCSGISTIIKVDREHEE